MLSDLLASKSQFSRSNSVAVLQADNLSEKEYISYLSVREKEKFVGIVNKKQRHDWLAGRLAVKYLFLNQLNMDSKMQAGQWQLVPLKLTLESLRSFSSWMYRKIEVLANNRTQSGYPRLTWCGKNSMVNVSLSHCGDMTSACIGTKGAVGIDVEMAVPRIDSFYRGNFTKAERNWVTRSAAETEMTANWLYTLLWTLKESILKSHDSNEISVWDFPKVEIKILIDIRHILLSYLNKRFGENFLFFKAQVRQPYRIINAQVAVTATRNLILTVIKI